MSDIQKREDALFEHISNLIEEAHKHVRTTIDTAMVYTYYGVGQYIVEDEQDGERRAAYGKAVLKNLSKRLSDKYGIGWSVATLKNAKKFYCVYSEKSNIVCPVDGEKAKHCLTNSQANMRPFTLSWSHYLILMRIENPDERNFYEIECLQQDWSVRQLQRQYASSLYERLALSRNKEEVMRLANEGQIVEKPQDVIKSPLTLEFLGLKPDETYSESKLENAIISKMQKFLLELGKGFLFEGRQKRFED